MLIYAFQPSALNNSKIFEGYTFVATPHKADKKDESGQAVDCGLYPNDALPKLEVKEGSKRKFGRTDWSLIEIAIECKTHSTAGDPFDEETNNHEPNAEGRRKVLGQILDYAEKVFEYQHRTFQYMLLFLGDYARIVRIDRAGIIATKKFNYRTDGHKLAAFLRYYTRLPPAERGHDTTAVRLDPESDEAIRMKNRVKNADPKDYVAQMFKQQLDSDWPWWKLEVTDDSLTNPKDNDDSPMNLEATDDLPSNPEVASDPPKKTKRYYLVGKPHFQAGGVAGRTTRGYVALDDDITKNDFVHLKDAWRVVSDDIEKEGVILETLREREVQYVPTLVCHGDVPGQETKTQEVWSRLHPEEKCHLKHHQHYRLVVKEVGKPLEEFSTGLELLTAICYAVLGASSLSRREVCVIDISDDSAHSQAYEHGIIHRDISAGNILLYKPHADGDWQGLLNDWELSKQFAQQTEKGRQPDRTVCIETSRHLSMMLM